MSISEGPTQFDPRFEFRRVSKQNPVTGSRAASRPWKTPAPWSVTSPYRLCFRRVGSGAPCGLGVKRGQAPALASEALTWFNPSAGAYPSFGRSPGRSGGHWASCRGSQTGEPLDTTLALQALAYVHNVYAELMADHAAPGLGTQNQAVHFILDDPELRIAVTKWAAVTNTEEASAGPSEKLPHDALYRRIREHLEKIPTQVRRG